MNSELRENLFLSSDESNINDILNDHCLINIFKNLSFEERLKIEAVCIRWRNVGKLSWNKVNSFEISTELFEEIDNKNNILSNANKTMNFVLSVLERCGQYLNCLAIHGDLKLNYSELFSNILKHCNNITDFSLDPQTKAKIFWDKELESLFKKFNLSRLSLSNINFRYDYIVENVHKINWDCNCLLSLSTDFITKLEITDCSSLCEDEWNNFFKKLTNLKILKWISSVDFSDMIKSLNISKCENLQEFAVYFSNVIKSTECPEDLLQLICRQKNLSILRIPKLEVDKDFLKILPAVCLQELNITCNIQYPLWRFENLKIIDLEVAKLTDDFIKNLINCIGLEDVTLNFQIYALTLEGENYFSKFQNIISLSLNYFEALPYKKDSLLKAISLCTTLRSLFTNNIECTYEGLENICKLPELRELYIRDYLFDPTELIIIVDKLKNLEEIYIQDFNHLHSREQSKLNDLLRVINNLKTYRNDNHTLCLIMPSFLINDDYFDTISSSFSLLSIDLS